MRRLTGVLPNPVVGVVSRRAASIRRPPKGAWLAPSPPLEERAEERRHHARCCGLGDIPASCGTNLSGMMAESDGLLSLSLSSRGGEGTGNARHLQAREGLGQHALTSASAALRRIVRYMRYQVRLPRRLARCAFSAEHDHPVPNDG